MNITPEQRRALDFLKEAWPDKAAEFERVLASASSDEARAQIKIDIGIKFRLDKFDGDYEPGKQPVETIIGEDNLGGST